MRSTAGVMSMSGRVCLLGAAPDTANLGVSALFESIAHGLHNHTNEAQLTVFDNGLGRRRGAIHAGPDLLEYERLGIRPGLRVYRPESLAHMRLSSRLPIFPNVGIQRIRSAVAALDISGGDSFADIYGRKRFHAMRYQKQLVLHLGTPLVLLPQTYGPYASHRHRAIAANIVARSRYAWARDADSFEILKDMLGDDYDPERHRTGVDVAFSLPDEQPVKLDARIQSLLRDESRKVIGINVSGLLANDQNSGSRFGLKRDYRSLMINLIRGVLDATDAEILLIPHVVSQSGVESDILAAERLKPVFPGGNESRVHVLRGVHEAQEAKWVIAQCEAFCGTRMHSTIAALSTCTPTVALAYSAKTRGVFATCGQSPRVVDLRSDGSSAAEDAVLRLWFDRREARTQLEVVMPSIRQRAVEPFMLIDELVRGSAE